MIFVFDNSSTFYNFHLPLIYVFLFVFVFKEKKSPMQSQVKVHKSSQSSQRDSDCLGLLSYCILYHILQFSVYKTFFTVITLRSLSKKKQFIWFTVVHIRHILNIPATPQKL